MTKPHPQLSRPELHRAAGAFLAAAIADAMGAIFEFQEGGLFDRTFPTWVLTGHGEMRGGGSLAPGEFTDDTQMALALALSLINCGEFTSDDVWLRWQAWASDARDVGIITRNALGNSGHVGAAQDAHDSIGQSAGNGALMRVTPLALWCADWSVQDLMALAVEQSALTHFDPAAGWGAAISAELIRRGIHGAHPIDEIDDVLSYVPQPYRDQFAAVLGADFDPHTYQGPSNGSVWICLAQAIWAVRHSNSLPDTLRNAINLGGDTDTVACVAGGLAGSLYGIQAIPSRWLAHVNGSLRLPDDTVTFFDSAHLQDIARQLVGRHAATMSRVETAAGPQEVAPNVFAANLAGAATAPTDWAILSFCRTEDRFKNHINRRESYIIDESGDHNSDIMSIVTDAIDTINAFLAAGTPVVVHCHGGRSRTGLILKAWAMRQYGYSERQAHTWLQDSWSVYEDYNTSFKEFLRTEWE